jgi:hypothetical protein
MATTQYLVDYDYWLDEATLHAAMGHLLVFVPGPRDAQVRVTVYFEDRDPASFELTARGGTSTETNYTRWPVEANTRFALRVESSEPAVCQATIGWNNAGNDYTVGAKTRSPHGVRECARSYMAIPQLSREWYLADGLVIDNPAQVWVRESEWALVLNPHDEPAEVTLNLCYTQAERSQHTLHVPSQRLRALPLDDLVQRNRHYGAYFAADRPVAAQWMRVVKWDEQSEIMAFWSVPCVPGPLAGA